MVGMYAEMMCVAAIESRHKRFDSMVRITCNETTVQAFLEESESPIISTDWFADDIADPPDVFYPCFRGQNIRIAKIAVRKPKPPEDEKSGGDGNGG